MKDRLANFLDHFYPPFRRIMPLQTFRYAACGGANTLLGLLIYFIAYQFIFDKEIFDFGFFAFKPHIAALFLSGTVTFILGFLLNKYIVFTGSETRGRIQLFRYALSFVVNISINYAMLKLLVEILRLNALLSQLFTTGVIITISYFSQKHFTFKVRKNT